MQTKFKTNLKNPANSYIEAECPVGQDLLRLRFDLATRQYAKVTLRFLPSGWSWTEEMGLIPAGTQVAEVELKDMPSGPFVLLASFYAPDQNPYTGHAVQVASHGVRKALAQMPYLCS